MWIGSVGLGVVLEIWVVECAFFEDDTVADDVFFFEFEFEFDDIVVSKGRKGVAFDWEFYGFGCVSEGEGKWECGVEREEFGNWSVGE